jgi:hypothetical protein
VNKTIQIRGIWVIKATDFNGGRLEILAELGDGTHHVAWSQDAIGEHSGPISHYVHPAGILSGPVRTFDDPDLVFGSSQIPPRQRGETP